MEYLSSFKDFSFFVSHFLRLFGFPLQQTSTSIIDIDVIEGRGFQC
ncbi:hypothetical protein HMPREF1351_00504 [Enterococcus faecium 510]|nr:hypothetical protein HMPREF1351_00504 [Enterococcus faecium 510]